MKGLYDKGMEENDPVRPRSLVHFFAQTRCMKIDKTTETCSLRKKQKL